MICSNGGMLSMGIAVIPAQAGIQRTARLFHFAGFPLARE
jgi:hypothetical protein